jgi:hypothetical protein
MDTFISYIRTLGINFNDITPLLEPIYLFPSVVSIVSASNKDSWFLKTYGGNSLGIVMYEGACFRVYDYWPSNKKIIIKFFMGITSLSCTKCLTTTMSSLFLCPYCTNQICTSCFPEDNLCLKCGKLLEKNF